MTYIDPYAGIPACADAEQAAYIAALPDGGPYNKVLSPPMGQLWLMG